MRGLVAFLALAVAVSFAIASKECVVDTHLLGLGRTDYCRRTCGECTRPTIPIQRAHPERLGNFPYNSHLFGDPDSYSAIISVTVRRYDGPLPFDEEALVDMTVNKLEERAVEGSFHLWERRTLPNGGVWLTFSFQLVTLCQLESVALIRVLPRYAFVVDSATCEDEWEEYEALMVDAIESFAVTPSSWR